jgi:Flp pilus assembly protein TadG
MSFGLFGAAVLCGSAVAAVLLAPDRRARRAVRPAALAADESGAAYALSYVMVMPVYLLLVCVIIEAALTMVVKLGTTYAAFAAARSYAVWLPANPGLADQKAQQAAAQAMTAFAGDRGGGGGGYGSSYQRYAAGEATRVSASYVDRKRAAAGGATRVSLDSAPSNWNGDVSVTVHYDMPFHIPAVGRILGFGRSMTISSRATTEVEGVKGKPIGSPRPLGIQYDPGEL